MNQEECTERKTRSFQQAAMKFERVKDVGQQAAGRKKVCAQEKQESPSLTALWLYAGSTLAW